MKVIQRIEPTQAKITQRLKVAAYARVSVDKGRTKHSLSAQISYYSKLIQQNPEWVYAGVYSDNGISGGSTSSRLSFKQMIQDAENGKIDIILTKSISRFARNTVDLLETVRRLKTLGVEVRFEKENIHSLTGDGELMLSILASFAQEEIQSMSTNIKWSIQKRYKQGLPNSKQNLYGYRWQGDELIVVPEEAEIVREIFANYLNKISAEKTAKLLTERGVKSFKGGEFKGASVRSILLNNTYNGTLQLQKEFVVDPLTKKSKRNKGEFPSYLVENHHEPIISMATWHACVEERARRLAEGATSNWSLNTTCFTSTIKCGYCGASFHRKRRKTVQGRLSYWNCSTKTKYGASHCEARTIREPSLRAIAADVLSIELFDEESYKNEIEYIEVLSYELTFVFKNGRKAIRTYTVPKKKGTIWTDEQKARMRAIQKEIWTDEQKAKHSILAKQKWKERKTHDKESHNDSSNDQ
ncbi:MAG: recombinase family protein [Streptococcaceae bacterium]|jgi:DNA invertase Pin-like site-specific DNA recombinase|nr:recombinase family protein [Streptococcaceae bacterium]